MSANPSECCPGHNPSKCTSHRTKDGKPCGHYPLKGSKVCGFHGGKAPQVRAAAERRVLADKAHKAVVTLGLPVDVTPHDALLEEVARSAGAVRWLEARVRELDPEALTWHLAVKVSGKHQHGTVDYTEHRAAPHPLLTVYQAERKHLTDVCRVTIAAGIEERRVHLAEHLGGIIADVMAAVLDDLNLSDFQREAARVAVPRQLRLLAGDLNEGIA